jgi:hypothetical protein
MVSPASQPLPGAEAAHDYGYTDLDAPQVASPRVYKTHFWYRDTPKGAGKYIYVTRGERGGGRRGSRLASVLPDLPACPESRTSPSGSTLVTFLHACHAACMCSLLPLLEHCLPARRGYR